MKLLQSLTCAALVLSLTPALMGCQGKGNHDKWVDDSVTEWSRVKSSVAMEMAQSHFNSGQIALAEKTVEDAMQADPENPQLWLMAGRVALENSELEIAYQRLSKSNEYGEKLEGYKNEEKAKPYYYQGIIDQRWQRF